MSDSRSSQASTPEVILPKQGVITRIARLFTRRKRLSRKQLIRENKKLAETAIKLIQPVSSLQEGNARNDMRSKILAEKALRSSALCQNANSVEELIDAAFANSGMIPFWSTIVKATVCLYATSALLGPAAMKGLRPLPMLPGITTLALLFGASILCNLLYTASLQQENVMSLGAGWRKKGSSIVGSIRELLRQVYGIKFEMAAVLLSIRYVFNEMAHRTMLDSAWLKLFIRADGTHRGVLDLVRWAFSLVWRVLAGGRVVAEASGSLVDVLAHPLVKGVFMAAFSIFAIGWVEKVLLVSRERAGKVMELPTKARVDCCKSDSVADAVEELSESEEESDPESQRRLEELRTYGMRDLRIGMAGTKAMNSPVGRTTGTCLTPWVKTAPFNTVPMGESNGLAILTLFIIMLVVFMRTMSRRSMKRVSG